MARQKAKFRRRNKAMAKSRGLAEGKMDDATIYTYAGVIFSPSAKTPYTYLADGEVHANDIAVVETSEGEKYTLVVFLSRGSAKDAPYPFEKLKRIKKIIKKSDADYKSIYDREFSKPQIEEADCDDEFFDDGDFIG